MSEYYPTAAFFDAVVYTLKALQKMDLAPKQGLHHYARMNGAECKHYDFPEMTVEIRLGTLAPGGLGYSLEPKEMTVQKADKTLRIFQEELDSGRKNRNAKLMLEFIDGWQMILTHNSAEELGSHHQSQLDSYLRKAFV